MPRMPRAAARHMGGEPAERRDQDAEERDARDRLDDVEHLQDRRPQPADAVAENAERQPDEAGGGHRAEGEPEMLARLVPERVRAVRIFLEEGDIVPGSGGEQERDRAGRYGDGGKPRPGSETQARQRIGSEQPEGESKQPEAQRWRYARERVAGRGDEPGATIRPPERSRTGRGTPPRGGPAACGSAPRTAAMPRDARPGRRRRLDGRQRIDQHPPFAGDDAVGAIDHEGRARRARGPIRTAITLPSRSRDRWMGAGKACRARSFGRRSHPQSPGSCRAACVLGAWLIIPFAR